MTIPVLTFFNNKGGVGKTSLVYHLAWMFARQNLQVVAVDLDPQANLTAAFLTDAQIEHLWTRQQTGSTIYQCVKPLTGVGDIAEPQLQAIAPNLNLLPGDVTLSEFEETLSDEWPNSLRNTTLYRPLRILSAFWQIMQRAAAQSQAQLILADVGPNLGAINRSALIATDFVIIPLGADLYSLQGLKNLGPALRNWRHNWKQRRDNWQQYGDKTAYPDFCLPTGNMQPLGYLCQQYSARLDRPVKAYDRWIKMVPEIYRRAVLDETTTSAQLPADDPYCLGTIKHYRSLVPMAQECRKPIFSLTPADGAIGSHANAVKDAWKDFQQLAESIRLQIVP